MIKPFSEKCIQGAVVLLLVVGSLVLVAIDLTTRPMFEELTKVVVGVYSLFHASEVQEKPQKS
jgi:hypothetical protein